MRGSSHVKTPLSTNFVNYFLRESELYLKNHLVQHNKQYHKKVLLRNFHLNGHTLGFHPQTQKLEPPCTA